jgi:hypothetical protein
MTEVIDIDSFLVNTLSVKDLAGDLVSFDAVGGKHSVEPLGELLVKGFPLALRDRKNSAARV